MTEIEYTSIFYDLQATEILTDVWKSRIITDVADTNNDENERSRASAFLDFRNRHPTLAAA